MEYDDGDWKELRARVDSLAGAVFLIAGGALTLSISILLNLKEVAPVIKICANEIAIAWHALLCSIICFLALKTWLIAQSFARGLMDSERFNKTLKYSNAIAWLLGLAGLCTFIVGLYKLVVIAVLVAHA